MNKLAVGVIGCGAFGQKHIAGYKRMNDVQIKVIGDVDPQVAQSLSEKYGIPKWTTDMDEILSDTSIQAISITSPEQYHYEQTMKAFQHGKHVFVEKPMATTVEQTDEMIATARKLKLVLFPGHLLRFEPRYVLAKERLGQLGTIHTMFCRRNVPKNRRVVLERVHPAQMTLTHDIDVALWFLNDHPVKVYAVDRSSQGNNIIDTVWALVQFKGGTIVCFESSWLLPERPGITPDSLMEVIAENGKLHITYPSNDIVLYENNGEERMDTSLWPEINGELGGALMEELRHFVQCVFQGTYSSIVPPEVSAASARLCQAILDSARLKQEIVLI